MAAVLTALLPEIVAYTPSTCSVLAVCRLPLCRAAFEHFLRWKVQQLSLAASQLLDRFRRSQVMACGYRRAVRRALQNFDAPETARESLEEALHS